MDAGDPARVRSRFQPKPIAIPDSRPPITLPYPARCVNLRRMRLLRFFRPSHQHTAFSATLLLMTTITLSRLIGYIREAYIAYAFGAGQQTDAYVAAFTLPDWLNYIVAGGTASITFISIYTRFLAEKREQDAQKTFSIIITVMTTVLIAGTVLAEIFTPQFAGWMFHGFTPQQMQLCVHLTRILLPAQIFFYVGGVVSAVLLSHRLFLLPAFGPLIYNVFIIAGGVIAGRQMGIASLAFGALAGSIAGPFLIEEYRRLQGEPPTFARTRGDGILTFDPLTDVYYSGTRHEEDQPCHLVILRPDICQGRCRREYGNPCSVLLPCGGLRDGPRGG